MTTNAGGDEVERFLLTCTRCGNTEPFDVKGKCGCGGTFLVEYDLPYLRKSWNRQSHAAKYWPWQRHISLPVVRCYEDVVFPSR